MNPKQFVLFLALASIRYVILLFGIYFLFWLIS